MRYKYKIVPFITNLHYIKFDKKLTILYEYYIMNLLSHKNFLRIKHFINSNCY